MTIPLDDDVRATLEHLSCVHVRVDTSDVVGAVDAVLVADGWSRRQGCLSRFFGDGR